MPPPALDDDLGFAKRVEDFAVEQLVSQARVEAFDIAVLPGAARFDVGGLCTDCADPFLHRFGHELRPVIGPDVPRHAAKDEKVGQDVDHVDRFELAIGADRQALVRELIDHIEHPVLAAIMGAVLDEVVGPDTVGMLGPQADGGAIGQPQEAVLGLRSEFDIYGTDYPTPDGTCIRDYIHVSDLVRAHSDALRYLRGGGASVTLNCGYGHGFSVREVIEMVKQVSGVDFKVEIAPRRPGDPAQIVAASDRARAMLGWTPQR